MAIGAALLEALELLFVLVVNYLRAIVRAIVPAARKSVDGQVAVITGAGHGIGRELALGMSTWGATVVLWDINTKGNEETAELVTKAGGRAYTYTVDVTNSAQIAEAAENIRKEVGEVSILINNAGFINCGRLEDIAEKDIRRTFEVNTLAHFWTVRQFLPSMLERKVGHILNVASMGSFAGAALMTDYCSSKFAARGFSNALRAELDMYKQNYVKVTTVCPMYVETGFLRTAEVRASDVLTPRQVALAAVDGLLREYQTVYVPAKMDYLMRFSSLLPLTTVKYLSGKVGFKVTPQYKKAA